MHMLEIPESHTLSRQVANELTGKQVIAAIANAAPHKLTWYHGDPLGYKALLIGRTLTGARALGGILELNLDGVSLALSDGVNARYYPNGDCVPEKHQLRLDFGDGSVLACTVAMYGGICAYWDGEYDNPYYLKARDKPDPLMNAFDCAYFLTLLRGISGKLSAKAFLATEQRIPGLGNGVLQDILFTAHIHPKRAVGTLTDAETETLYLAVKKVLRAMTDGGGRDTENDLYGNPGGYKTLLSRNTVGGPCPVCGRSILKTAYMGGAVYTCDHCQ
jgi:formamidopyrimidine-DNA glycosylase